MTNRQIEAAWAYHEGTKHSYESIRQGPHYLDWENQPLPFKVYTTLEPSPLSQNLSSSGMAALSAISVHARDSGWKPNRQSLAEILFLAAGVTRRRSYPGGEIRFRAAACTGALYHIDLYLVGGDLDGLDAGVYHFSPDDFSLRRLRAGDYRSILVDASAAEPVLARAPCVVICASTYWRNAWKYRARAYRHCYWDNGTILANLLAAAAARRIQAKVVAGFVDAQIYALLSLDTEREAPLSLVALGEAGAEPIDRAPTTVPLAWETRPLSQQEIDYPAMRAMHLASSLEREAEVTAWRQGSSSTVVEANKSDMKADELIHLEPLSDHELPPDTIEEVIVRRGSTRKFARQSIGFRQLSTMLDRATRGIEADFLSTDHATLNELYLIVHAVDGLSAGTYVYRRAERALQLLKQGDFRREAGDLGLGQEIPADCSVNVYFLSDLNRVLARFGNRGYRAAQLEASIMAGKLYLAAYAQHLGASGLTFFDDDVIDFFSPHAAGKSVMCLIALGKSVKRRTSSA